jgi:hypothetical protein
VRVLMSQALGGLYLSSSGVAGKLGGWSATEHTTTVYQLLCIFALLGSQRGTAIGTCLENI